MSTFLGSSNFSGANGSHFELQLYLDIVSQSVENNNSTLKYTLKMKSKDGYSGSGTGATKGYIKDNASGNWIEVGSVYSIGVNQTITVGTKTEIVPHQSDGTKSVNYGGYINSPWSGIDEAGLNGTYNLPRINRYATLVSAPDFNDEADPKITFTKNVASGATVYAGIFNSTGTTAYASYRDITSSVINGEYTFSLNSTERTALRNASSSSNTLQVQFKLYTTISSTNYDGGTLTKTMTIVNATPELSNDTYSEQNNKVSALLGSSGTTVVQNASTIRFGITATAKKNASITKVVATHSGTPYPDTSSPYSFDIPITASSLTAIATDTRNNTSTTFTKTWSGNNYITYKPVSINTLTFKRQTETSGIILLSLEATYYQRTFGSTANAPIVKWKMGTGSWTTLTSSQYTIDTTNNKLTVSSLSLGDILNYESDATFYLYIEDKLSTAQNDRFVSVGIPTLELGKDDVKVNGDFTSTKLFGSTWDFNTNNTTDTWVPVVGSSKWQHRAIPTMYNTNCIMSKLEPLNGRITNANISHTYENNHAHLQLLLASGSMTSNKPRGDGYILHCSWDNSGQYVGQLFIPNSVAHLQFRGCNNGSWGNWEDIHVAKSLYENATGTNGTVNLSETAANFVYLEIHFRTNDNYYASVNVFSPNSKIAFLCNSYMYNTGGSLKLKTVTISGTSITKKTAWEYSLDSRTFSSTDYVYITKVIGYR